MSAEDKHEMMYAYGLSGRKLKILRRFAGDVRVCPVSSCAHIDNQGVLMLWGSAPVPEDCPAGVQIVRLEDGFLRSVGLGADLIAPVSWVQDRTGIYYDATRSSDLELILQSALFDKSLLDRSADLRKKLVATGITKYNVGCSGWQRHGGAEAGNRVILVPGQVESDASLQFGAPGIHTNVGLLQAVREAHPDAY